VQVAVKDTGIGISAADMPHIFERFHRSEHNVVQANSGSGLGLSIVKTFIEMHDGRIWVESEPGKGTTFTFILEAT
jgi:signal transduction histidine kinase